ncbi:MAG: ATP-binding cassette domain-containing protein [Acidimicrobiales bacterium]
MTGVVLEARSVSKVYQLPRAKILRPRPELTALDDVSVSVQEGETLALVGESGSGKTTLVRLLTGLEEPSAGDVLFEGNPLATRGSALMQRRRAIQLVFQDPNGSLDPRMRVRRIITEPLRSLHIEGDHEQRMKDMLDAVSLPYSSADRYPHEFSGGQRQRIAIARALGPNPNVLVADEPVSALDVSVRATILNLLQDLKDEFALTVVLISHDLAVTHHVSDRVAVMSRGRIVESGAVEDVFRSPKSEYTRTLLSAIPRLGH